MKATYFTISLIIGLYFCAFAAISAPPPNVRIDPEISKYYKSLARPDKLPEFYSCCSEADCRPTSWRVGKDGYEALIDEKTWMTVPEDKIIRDPKVLGDNNPTGSAIVCYLPAMGILCFVPTAGS